MAEEMRAPNFKMVEEMLGHHRAESVLVGLGFFQSSQLRTDCNWKNGLILMVVRDLKPSFSAIFCSQKPGVFLAHPQPFGLHFWLFSAHVEPLHACFLLTPALGPSFGHPIDLSPSVEDHEIEQNDRWKANDFALACTPKRTIFFTMCFGGDIALLLIVRRR